MHGFACTLKVQVHLIMFIICIIMNICVMHEQQRAKTFCADARNTICICPHGITLYSPASNAVTLAVNLGLAGA